MSEKTEVETFFGRCRCCLAYGYLKNMWTEHQFDGEAEVYGEMLVQCFALTWDHNEDSMEQDQICEQCICRLRDANDFKKLVEDSQEELLQEIDNENAIDIKEERLDEDFLEEYKPESGDDAADTTYADSEYAMDTADAMTSVKDETEYEEIEYLEEEDIGVVKDKDVVDTDSSQPTDQSKQVRVRRKKTRRQDSGDEEASKRKWPKKLPKSERQKTYKQYSEIDLKKCMEDVRNNVLTPSEASIKYDIPKKTICGKMKMKPKDVTTKSNDGKNLKKKRKASEIKAAVKGTIKDRKSRHAKRNDDEQDASPDDQQFMYKHKANLKTILQYSNATLIKGYARGGFTCNFCEFQAAEPFELKQHNLSKHTNIKDAEEAIKTTYVSDLIIKLDTTCLKCKLCKEPLTTLEECMEHLSKIHSKVIHTDVKNYIIPFKFESNDFRCFMCDKSFKYFKLLSEHMPQHYRNFECSLCDRKFINKQAMKAHMHRHNRGVFKCRFCSKVFDTRPKNVDHERIVHTVSRKYRKCAYCSLGFSSWPAVREHEYKVHGVEKPIYKCTDCGKTCTSRSGLSMHINRCHLFIKPFKCSSCDMAFCTRGELSCHTNTHTKTRDFKCKICQKAFGTPITLYSHMRIHVGEKKLRCDHCELKFLHRTSYREHMKNQHGEIV